MYKLYFGSIFKRNVKKFDPTLQKLIFDKINLLKQDTDHPSLRTESLYPRQGICSSSVNMNIRIFWRLRGDTLDIGDVGKHDLYRRYEKDKARKAFLKSFQPEDQ